MPDLMAILALGCVYHTNSSDTFPWLLRMFALLPWSGTYLIPFVIGT